VSGNRFWESSHYCVAAGQSEALVRGFATQGYVAHGVSSDRDGECKSLDRELRAQECLRKWRV